MTESKLLRAEWHDRTIPGLENPLSRFSMSLWRFGYQSASGNLHNLPSTRWNWFFRGEPLPFDWITVFISQSPNRL